VTGVHRRKPFAVEHRGPARVELALRSRGDTRRLGHAIAACAQPGDLLLVEGTLGAGKTFLVRALARGLGVPTSIAVTSPTFELVHELPGRVPLVHADLYRCAQGESLRELGIAERVGGDAVVAVEWGRPFAAELGDDGLWIELDARGDSARRCALVARGPRGRAMLQALAPVLAGTG
jgi:tRNA threonylcarbamoyladenosine biosynthesis protein TsaE